MEFRVAVLVLAAGSSTRMGTSKQLLQLGSKSVLRHCIDTIASSGIDNITVVCGAGYDACAAELNGSAALVIRNEMQNSQMADSVRIGLRAIDEAASGVLVCLADHPLVSRETYQTLLEAHQQSPDKIIIPSFEGRRGHPSLFPYPVISEIFSVTSLRDVVRKDDNRVHIIPVDEEGVILDMDTLEDYRNVVEKFGTRPDGGPAGVSIAGGHNKPTSDGGMLSRNRP